MTFFSARPRPEIWSHLSTRWTGQTRLANSQAANHASWLVRYPPHAPGFSQEQSPSNTGSIVLTPSFSPFSKSQLMSPAPNLVIPLPHQFYRLISCLVPLGNRTRTSTVGARSNNHHATN